MMADSECRMHAPASALIIQLPTTSANQNLNQHTESDPNACGQNQGAATRLLGSQAAGRSHPRSRANATNLNLTTPNHQRHQDCNQSDDNRLSHGNSSSSSSSSNRMQHQRINHHRYKQSVANAPIDHHLLPQASSLNSGEVSRGTPPPNYHEIPGIVPSYHGRTSGPPPAYEDVVNPNAPPPSYQSLFGQVREARKTSNGLVDLLRQLFLVLIGTLGCTMLIGFLLLIPITMIFIGILYMNECRAENIPSFLVIGGLVWIMKNILNCYNQFKRDSSTINRPLPSRRAPIPAAAPAPNRRPANSSSGALQAADQAQPSPAARIASAQTCIALTSETVGRAPSIRLPVSSAEAAVSFNATSSHLSQPTMGRQPQHVSHPPMIGTTSYQCESLLNYFLIVWFLAGCIVIYRTYEPDYENPLSSRYCNRTVYLYAFWLMTSAFIIIMVLILSCLCCLMASSLMSCSHNR